MSALRLDAPVARPTVELVLAGFVFLLTAVTLLELAIPFEGPVGLWGLFLPATMVVPGLLALSVLLGVLAHGVRLGSSLVGTGERARPGDTSVVRILGSVALGALAAYTLWWAAGSLYVVYLGDPGGVLLHPYVVLALADALGALLVIRAVLGRLFSAPKLGNPRRPLVE